MKQDGFLMSEIGCSKVNIVTFLLFMYSFCQKLDLCSSLSDEGRESLSNWVERDRNQCNRFGVDCSNYGSVAAVNARSTTIRKLLQSDNKNPELKSPPLSSPSRPRSPNNRPPSSGASHNRTISFASLPPTAKAPKAHSTPPARPLPQPKASSTSHTSPPSAHASPPTQAPPNHNTNHINPITTTAKRQSHWQIFLAIGGAFFLLALSSISFLWCRANKVVSVRPWSTGLSGQLRKAFVTGIPALKRSELEVASEDFSNIIGSLSDCMLYKGTLSSGLEIAVVSKAIKSANDWTKESESQFRQKISILSKVNHRNFVNLLGYCEEVEPFTRMMVFEYAPNGSLFEHLHIRESEHLDWPTRLRIAMGIAYCLEHMHQLDPPVLLEKLDSPSIYLTEDFAAKISDLEFWNDAEVTSSSMDSGSPLQLSGTELGVYKFGLLLLEILSARRPFSEDRGELVLWSWNCFHGKKPLNELVDPTLETIPEEQLTAICEVIWSCISSYEERRPTMSDVAGKLREITTMTPEAAAPKLSPLWWAELHILSTEAS